MVKITVHGVVKTAVVSALTFAAALIWRDFVADAISLVVPAGDQLFYKLMAAIIATVIVIVVIYIVLQTEHEAEVIFRRYKHNHKKKR